MTIDRLPSAGLQRSQSLTGVAGQKTDDTSAPSTTGGRSSPLPTVQTVRGQLAEVRALTAPGPKGNAAIFHSSGKAGIQTTGPAQRTVAAREPGERDQDFVDRQIRQGTDPVTAVNNAGLRLESDSPGVKRVNYEQYRMFGADPKEALKASNRDIPPSARSFVNANSGRQLSEKSKDDLMYAFVQYGYNARDTAALLGYGDDEALIQRNDELYDGYTDGNKDGGNVGEVFGYFMEKGLLDRYDAFLHENDTGDPAINY